MTKIPTLLICLSPMLLAAQDVVLIPYGSVWKYLDNGTNQGTAWRAIAFNDATWASGPAELGYGEGDEATVVSYGPNASNRYITTYFRKTITIPNLALFPGFLLKLERDDGAVVYVNGTEVMRSNMNPGTISYTTLAYTAVSGNDETLHYEQLLPSSFFQNGTNVVAVEVHQSSASSSDLSFDLELFGNDNVPSVHRGAYLQIATPTSMVIKWKTDVPTNARVRHGPAPGSLVSFVDDATVSFDHEVTVTGLQPATTYYYSIGTTTAELAGNNATHVFRTSPLPGSIAPKRIWVTGDQGTANNDQAQVRDAYLNFTGATTADAWIWLGDNTYFQGWEAEYQRTNFDVYTSIFRNTPSWPATGNHDFDCGATSVTQTGPYFDLFALPKNAQAGGVPSNTEAYFSFDVGNVHLISLDSEDSPRSATGAMANWLMNDLLYARANSDWIIAYWHHPPYDKGGNNSDDPADSGGRLTDMRQNMLPILEANGVDLVLGGHSHVYERSYLINGHYGVSSTFNSGTMGINMGNGRSAGTGAYTKPGDLAPNSGTVYAVCGVSGKKETSGALNHPVMYLSSLAHFGSMVLDVSGYTLNAKFLNSSGVVVDQFDMVKAPTKVKLAIKTVLHGPYDSGTGLMRDDLRAQGLIPLTQPYSSIFTHVGEGGSEQILPGVLTVTGANAIVDWIFVELRDKSDPAIVLDTRAALLQRDGDVVDLDATSPLSIIAPIGAYYVAVRHRFHLATMTATPVFLNRTPLPIDLSSPATQTWGMDARKWVGGIMVQWAGNCVPDASIKYTGNGNDRDAVLATIGGVVPTNTVNGYLMEDANMDGVVKYTGPDNDRDIILQSIGGIVPTNAVIEQLP